MIVNKDAYGNDVPYGGNINETTRVSRESKRHPKNWIKSMTHRKFTTQRGDTIHLNDVGIACIEQFKEPKTSEALGMQEVDGIVHLTNRNQYYIDKHQIAYLLGREFNYLN
jgi:hypothetical protein